MELHGLDTEEQVFFYEQDFYVLSNFSSFMVKYEGQMFPTAEHAYHWAKFPTDALMMATIRCAASAHLAYELGQRWKEYRREDWDDMKVGIMNDILCAKVQQHHYVRRKLLATGERTLIENSWRDDFWGWGPNQKGRNVLGRLWMQIREDLRKGVQHHEYCDTLDPIIRTKPCNCGAQS